MQVPHPLQEHGARHHLSGAAHEKLEELELARRELDLAPAAGHPPGDQIELEILDLEARGFAARGAPAQQRLDARQELGERERLGEIVIAPRLEPADAVVDAAEGGQHQHRSLDAPLAQTLDDREAVELRQHAIGHDEIELPLGGAVEPLAPIGGVLDGVAALAQPLDEEARGLGIVFDEQHVHWR